MRRVNNNNTVIFIILVAFFTLLSFLFDQLVIQKEDLIRINQIKFNEANVESKKIQDGNLQLQDISLSLNRMLKNALVTRNYWIKNYLLYKGNNLDDNKFYENYRSESDGDYDYWIKYKMIKRYKDAKKESLLVFSNLSQVVVQNQEHFTELLSEDANQNNYLNQLTEFEVIFNNNLKVFSKKEFKFYNSLSSLEFNDIPDLSIKEWIDLNNFATLILLNTLIADQNINNKIIELEDLVEKKEFKINKIVETIKKNSSFKNYFILASIFSQIISLLFLLLLFKNLLRNIKLVKA